MARPRLFTIAPGAPFLQTFVAALQSGEIIPTLHSGAGPLALADATIYVPTRRAARALLSEFARASRGDAILLPKIRPLGSVDEEAALFADLARPEFDMDPDLPPSIDDIERRFLLTDLVLAWSQAIRNAIVGVGPQDAYAGPVVGATPADAFALAGDLAGLIDEFIIEGAPWSAVHSLVADDYDRYWRLTTDFLRIAIEQWPAILKDRGLVDAAHRRAMLIDREIARLASSDRDEATIVLGSTGTNRATARLMRAIARLPQGAVVLPGLDVSMPEADWRIVAGAKDERAPEFGHPQAALARLLDTLDALRTEATVLGAPSPDASRRADFVAQALAPSEATPAWRSYASAHASDIGAGFSGVALVEAEDEREEALAIAIRLRAVLETPGATAALITPDRSIARRVGAELRRWKLEIDDSGGEPLNVTPAGAFARAALAAASENTDVALTALLGNAATAPAHHRTLTVDLAGKLETAVLRATPYGPSLSRRIAAARAEPRPHPAARMDDDAWVGVIALVQATEAALATLRSADKLSLSAWAATHRACLAALAREAAPDDSEDATALDQLLAHVGALGPDAGSRLVIDIRDYAALFDALAGSVTVRGPQRSHARIKILGLLEARLLHVDCAVLAGLDETIWPPQPKSDAFLNRPMRAQIGLTPPERRIGQSAHDFMMALGAPEVVLTRARKRARAPTVASRFLQRMAALAGPHWDEARARGAYWTALAREIDRTEPSAPIGRPQPRPPLELRPNRLSVTRIETLRRDPYAIYAERILKLSPLGALDSIAGASEQGVAIHAALNLLAERWPSGPLPPDALELLVQAARENLSEFFVDPAWRAFRWPTLRAGLEFIIDYERERRPLLAQVHGEAEGELIIPLSDARFRLTARADRIEIDQSGLARIIDYKTGTPPSPKQVKLGFAAQLTLEAEMLRQGGFRSIAPGEAETGMYLKLGGRDGGRLLDVKPKGASFPELAREHWKGLRELLESYRDPTRGYASRPFAQFAAAYGDYDHLARVKEWSATGGATEGEE